MEGEGNLILRLWITVLSRLYPHPAIQPGPQQALVPPTAPERARRRRAIKTPATLLTKCCPTPHGPNGADSHAAGANGIREGAAAASRARLEEAAACLCWGCSVRGSTPSGHCGCWGPLTCQGQGAAQQPCG